ncbi:MAG: hypothetical protein KC502_17710 [Myxococcales bacterium]|nr:hypothetical protein [Myxococcales bacterium]
MFDSNQFYGHAGLLRDWCSVAQQLPINGRMQHGWTPTGGLVDAHLKEPWTPYVWSQRNLDKCQEAGADHAVALGAPFLYLPPREDPGPAAPRSLLVFPFHGWEKEKVAGDFANYGDAIAELEAEGYGPITVCLYWIEYEDPDLRAIFEDRGWRVVTAGRRDGNPKFLHGQRRLLLEHAFVTANRVCTAAFYALSVGRPFFLYGPAMGLDGTTDPDGLIFDKWQREAFPTLCYEAFGGRCEQDLGRDELGAEFVRQPDELRTLLGWQTSQWPQRLAMRVRRSLWALRNWLTRR